MERDTASKVTGQAQYTADLAIPGMLRASVLRSPYPHARILSIETTKAEAVPGVYAVLTRDDLQGISPFYGLAYKDQPILAMDKARYVGEPVAAVAAIDEATALEALDHLEVHYEPLPAVVNLEEALSPGAPLVHEEELHKAGFYYDLKDLQPVPNTNICHHSMFEKGDVTRGMAEADRVIENTFTLPSVNHYPLEPLVTTADFQGDYLKIWSATQAPFHVRQELAAIFGLPMSRVRVMVPFLGGGFGGKTYTHIEPLTAALARKAQRPVQLAFNAEETFRTICRCAFRCHARTGVKADGTLVAWDIEFFLDCGAYAAHAPRLANPGPLWLTPYRFPHMRVRANAVYTNTVPNAVLRGAPAPFMGWPRESQMDIIARELGTDPVELRLKNALGPEEVFAPGWEPLHFDLPAGLREITQALEKPAPDEAAGPAPGKKRGKGVACGVETTPAASVSSVVLSLAADGSLRINASVVEMGQGARDVLPRIAAEELGIPLERITVTHPDTEVTPYEQITSASRTTTRVGRAIEHAAQRIRAEVTTSFCELYEVDPAQSEVSLSDGYVHGGGQTVPLGEIVTARYQGMPGGEIVAYAPDPGSESGSATHVAVAGVEVEIDQETGEVQVLKFASSLSVGKAINESAAHGQNEGGVAYALGHALTEEMVYNDDGQLINGNLMEYRVPSFANMPEEFVSILVEDRGGPGPGGSRGIGEAGALIVMPAIANAVHDAVGLRFMETPLTPQRILERLADRTEG
ncbi:MAG: xanthine dehydrogenase family protein molybdopterin-binding subunit [Dehalococcoidia bacterium]